MMVAINILVFMFGVFLGLQLLSAFFLIIDLFYIEFTAYPSVVTHIVVVGGVTAVFFIVLAKWQTAFLSGIAFFVLLHVMVCNINCFLIGKEKRSPFAGEILEN